MPNGFFYSLVSLSVALSLSTAFHRKKKRHHERSVRGHDFSLSLKHRELQLSSRELELPTIPFRIVESRFYTSKGQPLSK